jgi:hypothetical protein
MRVCMGVVVHERASVRVHGVLIQMSHLPRQTKRPILDKPRFERCGGSSPIQDEDS